MVFKRLFLTVLAITIGLLNNSFSQDNHQSEKLLVLNTIFEQLKPKNCSFIALLADMDYRIVQFSIGGAMATSIRYDARVNDDSNSISNFAQAIKTDTCFMFYIKSFMQEKAVSRNDFIISEKFFSNLTAWTQSTWRQSKLYIEVHKPISGWEIFDLFEIDGDYSGTMQYELPFLFVPVFTYRVDGDKETKSQFIFKFKLDHENNKTIVKFVSKIEL